MHTVLLVEDDTAARGGLRELLEAAGFVVTMASDGAEALQRLERDLFDVMLLDMWLPKVNGLQVLSALGDRPVRPRVVVMTADDTPETALLTLRRHAYQFVRKPLQPAVLIEVLRRAATAPAGVADIIVLSARPGWVEVLVPCVPEIADRVQNYIAQIEVELPSDVRDTIGLVFRELLLDAMHDRGTPDPNRKVRIAYLRARKMLLYRIADAGYGFRSGEAPGTLPPRPHERRHDTESEMRVDLSLRPGELLARAQADEVLSNEPRTEVVVIKYLE